MKTFSRALLSVILSIILITPPQITLAANVRRTNKLYNLKTELDYQPSAKNKLSAQKLTAAEAFKNKTASGAHLRFSARNNSLRSISGGKAIRIRGKSSADKAYNFMAENAALLDVQPQQLVLTFERKSPLGSHTYFKQVYRGIPVENAAVKVHFNKKGEMLSYQSTYEPLDEDFDVTPAVGRTGAISAAAQNAGANGSGAKAELVLLPSAEGVNLAWKVFLGEMVYFIDAKNSKLLLSVSKNFYFTLKTSQHKVSPKDGVTQSFPIPYVNVGYYADDADASPAYLTDKSGVGTDKNGIGTDKPGRRLFANTTGKYFNVVYAKMAPNQNSSASYYTQPDKNTSIDADGRKALDAKLIKPADIIELNGLPAVPDVTNSRIRQVSDEPHIISTIYTLTPGSAPAGLAVNGSDLYYADSANHCIKQANGAFIAGQCASTGGDTTGALPQNIMLRSPKALFVTAKNNMYILDTQNNKIKVIFDITNPASIARTLPVTDLNRPSGIAVIEDTVCPGGTCTDTLYISNTANHQILSVEAAISAAAATATQTPLAGYKGSAGATDGAGATARFSSPMGLSMPADASAIYVADTGNSLVRKITLPGGAVSTVAGATGQHGYDGEGDTNLDGKGKLLNKPQGVFISTDGATLYIADTENNRIRKITNAGTTDGVISTLAGGGDGAYGTPKIITENFEIKATGVYKESTTNERIVADTKTFGRTFDCGLNSTYKPAFVAPVFGKFSVGMIDSFGVITQKDTLDILDSSNGNPLARYLGYSQQGFIGPVMLVSAVNAVMNIMAGKGNATTRREGYTVSQKRGYCMPPAVAAYGADEVLEWESSNTSPEMNAYINLNQIRDFLNRPNLNNNTYIPLNEDKPLSVMVDFAITNTTGAPGLENAFYDPDINAIYFGEGAKTDLNQYRHFALDNTSVRHEYMHYVLSSLWPIQNFGEGGAISEAVADYFALTSLRDMSIAGGDNQPAYTAISGAYALSSNQRSLDAGIGQYNPVEWAGGDIYANSLIISGLLWQLRTDLGGIDKADSLIFNSLFFFPDTLLELREAMLTACAAMGTLDCTKVEAAFDLANIAVPAAFGDIYEPNNGPVDAYGLLYGAKRINAKLNPEDDLDFYAVTVPAGKKMNIKLTLPQLPGTQQIPRYYPMGIMLMDDHFKKVIKDEFIAPENAGTTGTGELNIEYTTLTPLNGTPYTGRHIIAVYRPPLAQYSKDGEYTLNISFDGEPKTVTVDTSSTPYTVTFPYTQVGISKDIPPVLEGSLGEYVKDDKGLLDTAYTVRLLGDSKAPLKADSYFTWTPGDIDPAKNLLTGSLSVDAAALKAAYPYVNTVYVEVLGTTRAGANEGAQENTFSYGISSAILLPGSSGSKATRMWNNVFNPKDGPSKLTIISEQNGNVTAKVFTRSGLLVKELYNGPVYAGIPVDVDWDGRNQSGNTIASGIYVLKIEGAGLDIVQKIAAVR